MKIPPSLKNGPLILTAALSISLGFASTATGEVVGNIHHADGNTQIPFITGPNGAGATDLNSLVHMPAGIVLTQAIAINNLGYVIALSPVGPVPEPSSYALMLAGLALINFMLRRGSG